MRRSSVFVASMLSVGTAAVMWAAPVQAQEVGRVLSSTALISQVSVPRQVCAQEVVQVQSQTPGTKSGAGALMGAVAGGVTGNAIGSGNGRAAATILGFIGGAILGDRIEGASPGLVSTSQQTINRCSTQNFIENRTTGYQVVYEYAGKQYSVQMPQDPGPSIQLQVAPVQQILPRPVAQVDEVRQVAQPLSADNAVLVSQSPYQPIFQPQAAPVVVVTTPGYYYPAPVLGASFVIRAGNSSGYYSHSSSHSRRAAPYPHYPAYFR